MSVKIKTYILYGTKVDVSNFDTSRFEDEMDYCDYLYDVINKDYSPYKIIYDEDTNDYYFGYVIDKASTGNWENKYLSTQTLSDIMNKVTTEVKQAFDWMLLIHFGKRAGSEKVDYQILTVYC